LSRVYDEMTAPDSNLAEALFPVVDVFVVNEPIQGFIYQPVTMP
jgi:hypothetical protein